MEDPESIVMGLIGVMEMAIEYVDVVPYCCRGNKFVAKGEVV